MSECSSCIQNTRIDALEQESKRNGKEHREFQDKISEQKIESAIMSERHNAILSSISGIKDDISEARKDIAELTSKPGKKWESVSMIVITALTSGAIGFLFNFILSGGMK